MIDIIKDIKKLRLLTESVDHKSIIDAIETHNVVYIYYNGMGGVVNRGYRTIEPYAFGTHKTTGNLLLRAWQQSGASDTKGNAKRKNDEIPGWRLFNVEGISSWMPVKGNKAKFKDSVTPRPSFNPNDKALNVISAFSLGGINTQDSKGIGSIEKPNVQSKEDGSVFDNQTSGFKSFNNDSNDFQFKKNLTFLYGKLKYSRKQNPKNFVVINNNGELKIKASYSRYDKNKSIGNLDDLFKKISGLENVNNVSQSQFEKYQNELNNSGSLLGGNRSKPISNSFFKKHYDEMENNLKNS